MSTALQQQQYWTPTAGTASSCSEVHQHLDDVPYLLDEPAWGTHDHHVPGTQAQLQRSFSLSSSTLELLLHFTA